MLKRMDERIVYLIQGSWYILFLSEYNGYDIERFLWYSTVAVLLALPWATMQITETRLYLCPEGPCYPNLQTDDIP